MNYFVVLLQDIIVEPMNNFVIFLRDIIVDTVFPGLLVLSSGRTDGALPVW